MAGRGCGSVRYDFGMPEPDRNAQPVTSECGPLPTPEEAAALSEDAIPPAPEPPAPLGPGPVFVIGAPRSGTSALAWAIAAHPEFVTGNEADFTFYLLRSNPFGEAWVRTCAREDSLLKRSGMSREVFMRTLGAGIDAVFRAMHEATGEADKRWVDSTPANTLVGDRLAELLPDARFIHILRDGRAAVASMVKSGFETQVAKDFRFACDTWSFYTRKARQLASAMPHRVLELRQERMASDPEGSMSDVLAFLGVGAHDGPAAKLREGRINSSYGNAQASDVLKAKSASEMPSEPWSGWTDEQWGVFEEASGAAMSEMGYAWTRPERKPEASAEAASGAGATVDPVPAGASGGVADAPHAAENGSAETR